MEFNKAWEDVLESVQTGSGTATPDFVQRLDVLMMAAFQSLFREYGDEDFSRLVALKAANLLIRKFEYSRRRKFLMSHPYQLTVDPSNGCQLACPGCIHSEEWVETVDWPNKTLRLDRFNEFMQLYGPMSFVTMLYNFGEPLLNKRFPDFVKLAKSYYCMAVTSSNLSLPINADAIVESGLDVLIMSVDGATQEKYGRYRKKGDIEQVYENMRLLVEARRQQGRKVPELVWQFLTFEHNQDQVEDSLRIAKKIGVDCVRVCTPGDWGWNDQTIKQVKHPMVGEHRIRPKADTIIGLEEWRKRFLTDQVKNYIFSAFSKPWAKRYEEMSTDESSNPHSTTCNWLYDNITMDGASRLMPCCLAPLQTKPLVFGHFDSATSIHAQRNSKWAVLSRMAFADRGMYEEEVNSLAESKRPFCGICRRQPLVPFRWPFPLYRVSTLDPKGVLGGDAFKEACST